MCFGPVASFTASGILASIGTEVLRNVRSKREILFAIFPILFALQQGIEGILWLMIKKGMPEVLTNGLAFVYLLFAYSLWPILCPVSVYAIEYDPKRIKILHFFVFLGLATGFYLFLSIITNPIHVTMLNCSLRYDTYIAGAHLFTGVYVAAVIMPYFFSSHRAILIFGIPNLIFCIITYVFYNFAFISVWCFFAAILSLTLYFFLRKLHHQPLLVFLEKN